ncbi:MAG TPA: VOC family protein [Acidimicrobiia bacterium]|nr:VOC family protein [Acidimicrobiia bacterium]
MGVSVRYIVDDVQSAMEFYRDHLDFEVEMDAAPGFAALRRGDLRLLVNAPGAGGAGKAGGSPEPGGWNRFQVEVDDLQVVVDDLRSQEVVVRGDIVEGGGGNQAVIEDPAGNPIELFQPAR